MNFWESFAIHAAAGIVRGVIKNPKHAAELKHVLLELRDAINEAYPEDGAGGASLNP